MSRIQKTALIVVTLVFCWGLSGAWAADTVFTTNYNTMYGLNGRSQESCPICLSDGECSGGATCLASPKCLSEIERGPLPALLLHGCRRGHHLLPRRRLDLRQ